MFRHPEMRGPLLAELEMVTRVGGELLETSLVPLLLAYMGRFSSKPTCFSDLKKYISFIPDSRKEELITRLVFS